MRKVNSIKLRDRWIGTRNLNVSILNLISNFFDFITLHILYITLWEFISILTTHYVCIIIIFFSFLILFLISIYLLIFFILNLIKLTILFFNCIILNNLNIRWCISHFNWFIDFY